MESAKEGCFRKWCEKKIKPQTIAWISGPVSFERASFMRILRTLIVISLLLSKITKHFNDRKNIHKLWFLLILCISILIFKIKPIIFSFGAILNFSPERSSKIFFCCFAADRGSKTCNISVYFHLAGQW